MLFENLRSALRGTVLENEPLCRHTTWRVGGPADLFVVPEDRGELLTALEMLGDAGVPWSVLGAGSNLLVLDGGFRGAVIHPGRLQRLEFEPEGGVRAGGGAALMTLIRECARRGLSGLESLAGIPATVGGGVAMNAGAGDQDLSGVLGSAILAGPGGEETWPAERFRFGYRSSALGPDRVLVEAHLVFRRGEPAQLEEEIRRRLAHRRASQGVGAPNAGSVFCNPPGQQAWRLIDESGLRGLCFGGAQVSEKHANFIVNRGGASAADILALIERVRETVLLRTGVLLETEVRIVGEKVSGGRRNSVGTT